jgi:hypothetical protein
VCAVKRAANRGWIIERWSDVAGETPISVGQAPLRSGGESHGSGIERFTGTRVVSRLQKSAGSIFSGPTRKAARRTESARSSTGRQFSAMTRRSGAFGAKRVRGVPREPHRDRRMTHPNREVRTSFRRKAPRISSLIILTRWCRLESWQRGFGDVDASRLVREREIRRSRASACDATRGVRGSRRLVRLPQPKGAGGLQPTRATSHLTRMRG